MLDSSGRGVESEVEVEALFIMLTSRLDLSCRLRRPHLRLQLLQLPTHLVHFDPLVDEQLLGAGDAVGEREQPPVLREQVRVGP